MILKIIKTTHNFCLISILIFCFSQNRALSASKEPIISVLILKDKKIRIRSDRSIPLTIKGQRFSNKKIKGLTLKMENNRKFMFFDKNKQKVYGLERVSFQRPIFITEGPLDSLFIDNCLAAAGFL